VRVGAVVGVSGLVVLLAIVAFTVMMVRALFASQEQVVDKVV